jgi:hypothetical protein
VQSTITIGTLLTVFAPFVLAVLWQQWSIIGIMRDIKKTSDVLLEMHRNPGSTGFGTARQDIILLEIRDIMKDLIHYVLVDYKNRTGAELPPREPVVKD